MRSPKIPLIPLIGLLALIALALACGGSGSTPPPPPPQGQTVVGTAPQAEVPAVAPPGQVLVTVAASSTPQGAVVTGGGRMLGRTPFTTQVPIPAATGGQTQTFQFTFQLPGYQPATISASPINNTITLNAALAPMVVGTGAVDPTTGATTGGTGGATGASITARGTGGGRIVDMSTTTSTARVAESCTIGTLAVDVDGTHSYFSDLVVSLRGPDGTNYQLQSHAGRNPFRSHTVRRAAGRPSAGEWTVSVADTVRADSGQLRGFTLSITCQ